MLKKLVMIIVIIAVVCITWVGYRSTFHYSMDGVVITEWTDDTITIEDSRGELWEVDTVIGYDTRVKIYFDNNGTIEDRTDDTIEKIEIKM